MRLSAPIFRLKRQARLLGRDAGIPLHAALDRIAKREGFRNWSHLAASVPLHRPGSKILSRLTPGDLVLLGARPGHGKTILGLELAVEAARTGRHGFFFTLDLIENDILRFIRSLDVEPGTIDGSFTLDTSDDICADHIIARLDAGPAKSVAVIAVIDYLQLLDQKRRNPELADQIRAMKNYAAVSGAIIVAISQIDRSFDPRAKQLPDLSDVRLPNALDLTLFTKTCFLHDGEICLDAVP
jgi:replicative DNA helicase